MALAHITNHTARALARVLEQYKGKTRLIGLLTACADQLQQAEDALWNSIAARMLATATGATLDMIGTVVNVGRHDLVDADYRSLLRGAIAVQNSDGTQETLLAIAMALFEGTAAFLRTPNSIGDADNLPSAVVAIGVGDPTMPSALWGFCLGLLQAALDTGIALDQFFTFSSTKAFAMAGDAAWVAGFDDGTGNVGGGFAADFYSNPIA